MRIISVKNGFTADHSSTSYEFLAVGKPLGKKERAAVASLSSRANPTSRRVSFVYHVEGYDIPGGWGDLLEKYYDVMYREDYDWWTLAMAFNTTPEQLAELEKYEFYNEDDLGIETSYSGDRAIVAINCRIDISCFAAVDDYYDVYDEEEDDDDDDNDDDDNDDGDYDHKAGFAAGDELLNLLVQVREQLVKGDYRALYAVWQKYGNTEDEENNDVPPAPPGNKAGKVIVERFIDILEHC